jgi:hypothetical protein
VFSDQDKLLTKEMGSNFVEYGSNAATDRKREFKSPDIGLRKNDKMKDRSKLRCQKTCKKVEIVVKIITPKKAKIS